MGLVRRLSDQRTEQILRKAAPFLTEGEDVVGWARARDPDRGRRGVFFLTEQRALVRWSSGEDHDDIPWELVKTWGLDQGTRGGPVLCIETVDELVLYVQLSVQSHDMARNASDIIRTFAEHAPWPEQGPVGNGTGNYVPSTDSEVQKHKRTPMELFKRWGLTVLGGTLIIVGILIIPLPGPWSFILNIAGLAVLAREYDWAEDLLDWTKERFEAAKRKISDRRKRKKSQA